MSRVRVSSEDKHAYQKDDFSEVEAPPKVNASLPGMKPPPEPLEEDTKVRLAIQVSNASVPGAHVSNQAVRPKPSQSQLLEKSRMKERQMNRDCFDRESLRPEPLPAGEEQHLDGICIQMNEFQKDANKQDELEEERNKRKRKRCLLCGFAILIGFLGITVGISVGLVARGASSKDSDTNVAAQEAFISDVCYLGPATDQSYRYTTLRSSLLSQLSSLHANEIDTAGSAARASLCWLTEVDDFDINIFDGSESDVTQRFALAYVYFHFVELPNKESHRLSAWNWLSGLHVCDWDFVGCDSIAGKVVTGLTLGAMRLEGEIPKHLALLSDLVSLHLSRNQLKGQIPSELFQLTKLEVLNLYSNELSGQIPSDLTTMTQLRVLSLSHNKLTGTLSSGLGSSLSELTSLILSDNSLSGTIPTLSGMSNLKILEISSTFVEGSFPDISGCSNLGTLPAYIWTFPKLFKIDLVGTRLSGTIPYQTGELALNLEYIDLRKSDISGSIPTTFGNLSDLRYFELSLTKVTGLVPTELGRLTNLEYIRLPDGITGVVPEEVCMLLNQSLRTLISPSRSCHCCTQNDYDQGGDY